MSWEYLHADPDSATQSPYAPHVPKPRDGTALDGYDVVMSPHDDDIAQHDQRIRSGIDNHNRFVNQGIVVGKFLRRLYSQERYAALNPANIAVVSASVDSYNSMLARPNSAESLLGSDDTWARPDIAAASLAALSVLSRAPYSSAVGKVMQWAGFGSQKKQDNMEAAKDFVVNNRLLLVWPNGVLSFSDAELQSIGLRGEHLDEHRDYLEAQRLVGPGESRIPATLAVLMADIVHSRNNPMLPHTKPSSDSALRQARTVVARAQRLERYSGVDAGQLNLQKEERRNLDRAQRLIEADQNHAITERERNLIEGAVVDAAVHWLGFEPGDQRLPIMAECLVSAAHHLGNIPDATIRELARRMHAAAQRSRVHSANDLPPAAAKLYARVMRHYTPASTAR